MASSKPLPTASYFHCMNNACKIISPGLDYKLDDASSKTNLIVEFFRCTTQSNDKEVFHVLLFSALSLLGKSLPDMTAEGLLQSLMHKGSRTILIFQDNTSELQRLLTYDSSENSVCSNDSSKYEERSLSDKQKKNEYCFATERKTHEAKSTDVEPIHHSSVEIDRNVGEFDGIFSEDSSECEEESEDSIDIDFLHQGFQDFVTAVRKDRHAKSSSLAVKFLDSLLGVAVFEKSYRIPNETVIHLQLLAVRKKHRKQGVGSSLVEMLKDPSVVGECDTIVTCADQGAIEFFGRRGFVDDLILNARYRDIVDNWLNSTPMCYIRMTGTGGLQTVGESLRTTDPKISELAFDEWRQQYTSSYLSHLKFSLKVVQQLRMLKQIVEQQEYSILYLKKKNIELRKLISKYETFSDDSNKPETSVMEKCAFAKFCLQYGIGDETQVKLDFLEDMMKSPNVIYASATLSMSPIVDRSAFENKLSTLGDPSLYTTLYFCLKDSERLQEINTDGFSYEDFLPGSAGFGLYFSTSARAACCQSLNGAVLVALVGIGMSKSVVNGDASWTRPPEGYDSLLTVDRDLHGKTQLQQQCFVVFHPEQATPICVIRYNTEILE